MVLNWAQEQQGLDKGAGIPGNMVLGNSGFPDAKEFSPKYSAVGIHALKKANQPKVKEYRLGVAEYYPDRWRQHASGQPWEQVHCY
jgi:hypothetical protein